ncbi:NAD(P)/FAD-dependent oxidoreductase [Flavobacterium sp. F-65]|uniref:NAD(P)/FAD-dependent oxidoreductase n=1 Tax=Flavobacterium pisciphilum TaxID=2893755 RepID=A0ABS8MR63_9FLAO|nr:NAD(P)/FAD-dependent oxidoreductase [Flavobacterium sp. F-65]
MIIGGGPAGLATAITLRKHNIPCVVINNHMESTVKLGESLAPSANTVFRKLSLGDVLASEHHSLYVGNNVVWGDSSLRQRYFFNEPYGDGRHLNRTLFEKQLQDVAIERGVVLLENHRLTNIIEEDNKIIVSCSDSDNSTKIITADFIADCSGRASIVAKKMGIKKQTIDNLASYYFITEQSGESLKGMTFIEAVEDGWWYAAPLANNKVIVNFMSDSDLHTTKSVLLKDWLFNKVATTQYLKNYFPSKISSTTEVRIKTATTSLLEKPGGKQWIAVGDALCTYDPLTSFGITNALVSGHNAANAISDSLNGNTDSLSEYITSQMALFNKSVALLQNQYQSEQRWHKHPFWERRQL